MANFGSELRSLTGGRGTYGMQFLDYQEVPAHLSQGIVEAAKAEKEQQ
jgi:elongation factor G